MSDPTRDSEGDRQHVKDEVADRLRRRGVSITGQEHGEELATLLDAVERFETAVEARGGDLMVDEPVNAAAVAEPDDLTFVLPERGPSESVASFVERIEVAIDRMTQRRRSRGS